MGYTDLATSWEPSGIQMLVPSQDRDFSRPKEPYYAQSIPTDSNMADDIKEKEKIVNPQIKSFQEALSQSLPVVGKVYQGPVDGIANPELGQACQNIEGKLSKILGVPINGMIYNQQNKNVNISVDDLKKSLQAIAQHLAKTDEKSKEKPDSTTAKNARFQALLRIYKNI